MLSDDDYCFYAGIDDILLKKLTFLVKMLPSPQRVPLKKLSTLTKHQFFILLVHKEAPFILSLEEGKWYFRLKPRESSSNAETL